MSNDTVVSLAAPALVPDPLTELLRSGARRLVEAAVRAEFEEHLSAFGHEKLPDGRQRVVRNGRLPERKILTGLGEVNVRVPKARGRILYLSRFSHRLCPREVPGHFQLNRIDHASLVPPRATVSISPVTNLLPLELLELVSSIVDSIQAEAIDQIQRCGRPFVVLVLLVRPEDELHDDGCIDGTAGPDVPCLVGEASEVSLTDLTRHSWQPSQ